ncbi:hypothetical protein [Streptomyces sp. NPDC056255]|uniref:hypothetical protein n=1 Tax=Streptomyces sp. NPDC056255 TaxID=3345764 RepID=UPI0035D716BD
MYNHLSSSAIVTSDGAPQPRLREMVEQLVLAAVPEFLGALAAAVVIAAATWSWRHFRNQPPSPPGPDASQ